MRIKKKSSEGEGPSSKKETVKFKKDKCVID